MINLHPVHGPAWCRHVACTREDGGEGGPHLQTCGGDRATFTSNIGPLLPLKYCIFGQKQVTFRVKTVTFRTKKQSLFGSKQALFESKTSTFWVKTSTFRIKKQALFGSKQSLFGSKSGPCPPHPGSEMRDSPPPPSTTGTRNESGIVSRHYEDYA